MKNIGTLPEQVKLTDEEIDNLPGIIKFIKHQLLENQSEDKTIDALIRKFTGLVDLNELRLDTSLKADETDAAFVLSLITAVSLTAGYKEEKQKSEIFSKEKFLQEINKLKQKSDARDKKIEELRGTISHLNKELSKNAYERANLERELKLAQSKAAQQPCNNKFAWNQDKNLFDTTKVTCGTGASMAPQGTGTASKTFAGVDHEQAKQIRSMLDEIFDSADYFSNRLKK